METARGRWFLGEYAKRNRNADTAMVLEAVTRLEQSVAASRNEASTIIPAVDHAAATPPVPAHDAIIASVKIILERTRAALVTALSVPDTEQALAPFQRSARIIQEIAWGLRESGSDGRICTMLDAQVRAMTLACESFAATEHREAILHTFDASLVQIEKLADGETALASDEPVAAVTGTVSAVPLNDTATDSYQTTETRAAEDHGYDGYALPDGEVQTVTAEIVAPEMDASVIEVVAAPETLTPAAIEVPSTIEAPATPTVLPDNTLQEKSAAQSSLGDSLIARGIVASAIPPRDPLAPIRRMSQAEKIAFFS